MFANINFTRNSPFSFIEYAFQAYYATVFLMVWLHPEQHNVSLINDLAILMAFEFIMVHSGVFMAVMPKKLSLFVFFPMYGLFALAFHHSVINTNILYIYLLTVLNRMRFAFSNVSPEIRALQIGKSVAKAMFYFFLIFAVCFANGIIPKFGLTDEFLEKSHYFDTVKSSGLFIDKPYVPICMGFIYYSLPVLYFIYRTIKNFGRNKNNSFQEERLIFSKTTYSQKFKSNKR
ncbi:hypothetical protein [[Flexibacter] sp. ATCC 35103]|uniref:hypothetical protein n=1 Tax=[Flexibacter] sp. ATCC 35103 TaxID=1937528 RepID=UPI0009D1BB57|nr:hypothetical protein [[Flexibacter] sp. ATCC 35103]OMQ12412.1 hypothetical protein BXU01_05920 [[Flexibacter] sp. ATCC 35103]